MRNRLSRIIILEKKNTIVKFEQGFDTFITTRPLNSLDRGLLVLFAVLFTDKRYKINNRLDVGWTN